MQTTTDTELLRDYVHHGSEAAFGEIVRRYADFVYSAAVRQVVDPELARDVAQLVFVDLARKAKSLHPNTLLIGWLCRGARLVALEQLRKQHRRLQRERLAMDLAAPSPETANDWSAIQPVLDEALARLAEEDRSALLLRYFNNQSLASVGATLGVSEDAAQKRVSRALGRLREFLAQRGIHTTAAALSVALTANALQAAPAGLAASLAAGALAQAVAGASSISLVNLLTSHHMKTAILSLILAGGVAGLTVQQIRTQRQLSQAQTTIRQQSESLQAAQGLQEQLAAQRDTVQQTAAQQQELVRLRGEVARLRRESARVPTPAPVRTASTTAEPTTNAPASSIGLSAKFVLLPSEDLKLLNVAWSQNPEGTASGLLTQEQFQTINQALAEASNVKVLGSPRVITGSGMEAKLFSGPNRSGGSAKAGYGGGGGGGFGGGSDGGAGGSPFTSSTNANPGMTLSVLPYYTAEASTFDLQLTAGFAQWTDRSPQQDGSQKEVRLTQSKVHQVLPLGQTLVLAKEVPNEGWTEADNTVPGPKTLLVFITPSMVQTVTRLQNIIKKSPR